MEWKPIESAPKDGTAVLLCDMSDDPNGRWCWHVGTMAGPVVGWWGEFGVNQWRDSSDLGCHGQIDYQPTHWMPLPDPPSRP